MTLLIENKKLTFRKFLAFLEGYLSWIKFYSCVFIDFILCTMVLIEILAQKILN